MTPTISAALYTDLLAMQDRRDDVFREMGLISRALSAIAHDGTFYPGEDDELQAQYATYQREYDQLDAQIQTALGVRR